MLSVSLCSAPAEIRLFIAQIIQLHISFKHCDAASDADRERERDTDASASAHTYTHTHTQIEEAQKEIDQEETEEGDKLHRSVINN